MSHTAFSRKAVNTLTSELGTLEAVGSGSKVLQQDLPLESGEATTVFQLKRRLC
jgi:hypothetical protein